MFSLGKFNNLLLLVVLDLEANCCYLKIIINFEP